jgi:adenosylcobinamide-phosphate synthase
MRITSDKTTWEEGTAVLVAACLDLLGEPPAALHPVVWYGWLIERMVKVAPRGNLTQLLYGMGMVTGAALTTLIPAWAVHHLAKRMRAVLLGRERPGYAFLLYALIEGVCLKPLFALRMLVDTGRTVRLALERDDLPQARVALRSLVSRDRSQLSSEQVGAAAIESLAENLSDSVVAPLFYFALFGLPGAATYRLVNTFDAMIGYHGRYEYLGKAAARLDDLLNMLPSRLTALLILGLAPLFGGSRQAGWRIWRRDARKTASPNAGHPMAAAAGALRVQLTKVEHYTLGDAGQAVTAERVRRAEVMTWWVGGCVLLLTAILKTLVGAYSGSINRPR